MISNALLFARALAPFLYFVAIVGVYFGVRRFLRALGRVRVAQFRLEREQAQEMGGRAITQIILMIELGILAFFASTVMYDTWTDLNTTEQQVAEEAEAAIPFRTAVPGDVGGEFATPTPVVSGQTIIQTPEPSPTPGGTLLPADAPIGCIAEQANINQPDNGQIVFEVETITGTADIENFAYYRFEIRDVLQGGSFGVIGGASSDYTVPVVNGPLGSIVPQNFAPSEYRFRLTVFDTGGVMRAACEITIFISDPLPTPTPIGAAPPQTDTE